MVSSLRLQQLILVGVFLLLANVSNVFGCSSVFGCFGDIDDPNEVDKLCRGSGFRPACYCCGGFKQYITFGTVCRRLCRTREADISNPRPCNPGAKARETNLGKNDDPLGPFPNYPTLVPLQEIVCSSIGNGSVSSLSGLVRPQRLRGQTAGRRRSRVRPQSSGKRKAAAASRDQSDGRGRDAPSSEGQPKRMASGADEVRSAEDRGDAVRFPGLKRKMKSEIK